MLPRTITINSFADERGLLSVCESNRDIAFDIKRVFWITDLNNALPRGGHAHQSTTELIFAVRGSFTLHVRSKNGEESFRLSSPEQGVFVHPYEWCDLCDFSEDCVLVVLTDEAYRPDGYINTTDELTAYWSRENASAKIG